MSVRSGFFNSIAGDRKYNAKFFAEFFGSLIGNGVFPNPSTGLQVMSNNDMTVTVNPGKGWIEGYIVNNDDDHILQIEPADGVLNRIDRVVLRWDSTDREIRIEVKKGAFASIPVAPSLQRDADAYELGIADIAVNKGVTRISQATITDLRLNGDICGIVHGLIDQIDPTTIFNQYMSWLDEKKFEFNNTMDDLQSEFDIWLNSIKDILDENVAGNLLSMIENLGLEIDNLDGRKVEKEANKGLSTNDYTNEDKNKLEGIAVGANNYVHPTTAGNKHIPAGGATGQVLGYGGSSGTAAWIPPVGNFNVQEFTSSGNWIKPEGAKLILIQLLGAGGGGGGGARSATESHTARGGSGGGGGAYFEILINANLLPATVPVLVGAGGSGGAPAGASAADGNDGGVGGDSSFYTRYVAAGGSKGNKGMRNTDVAKSGDVQNMLNIDYFKGASGGGTLSTGAANGSDSFFGGAGGGGGSGSGNPGAVGGVQLLSGFGSGGIGGNYNSAAVSAGGEGAIGCGGGGGHSKGTANAVSPGAGGRGGNGLVRIYAW